MSQSAKDLRTYSLSGLGPHFVLLFDQSGFLLCDMLTKICTRVGRWHQIDVLEQDQFVEMWSGWPNNQNCAAWLRPSSFCMEVPEPANLSGGGSILPSEFGLIIWCALRTLFPCGARLSLNRLWLSHLFCRKRGRCGPLVCCWYHNPLSTANLLFQTRELENNR